MNTIGSVKRRKIGVISYYNLKKLDNGGKLRNYNISKELTKIGHEIYMVFPEDTLLPKKELPFQYKEVKIESANHVIKIIKLIRSAKEYFSKKSVDIILIEHAWSLPVGIIVSFILKKKIILDNHNIEFIRALKMGKFLRFVYALFLEFILLRKCNAICLVSEEEKIQIRKYISKTKQILVVPNGSNILPSHDELQNKLIYKNQIFKKYNIPNEKFLTIFIGDLLYEPNFDAIRILEQISKKTKDIIQIIVIGNKGNYKPNHQVNVIYTGYVENLNRFVYGSDFTIIPMITGGGTNLKILEAMTVGLPIICTNKAISGIPILNKNYVIISDDFCKYPFLIKSLCENLVKINRNDMLDFSRHWNICVAPLNEYLFDID